MTKKILSGMFVPITLAMTLLGTGVASGQSQMQVPEGLNQDPHTIEGMSGGGVDSGDCGYISSAPNLEFNPTQPTSMRLEVEAQGQPTILVEGASGRFCSRLDISGDNPKIYTLWLKGVHKVYVGDESGNQHPFRLYLSQQKN